MEILITGAAGYIGGLIIKKLSLDPAITAIIGIDALPRPEAFNEIEKLAWIQADLADAEAWTGKVPAGAPDAVIHCAFAIRNPYGRAATKATEERNLATDRNVFRFAFARNAARLVELGSVASYSAKRSNIGRLLTENEPLSETLNPYGFQKAESERILAEELAAAVKANPSLRTQTSVVRLSVTGPRGQSMESKFGLVTFIRKLLPFIIQADPHWARQYVHEDDVRDAIIVLALKGPSGGATAAIEAFNIAPSQFLTAKDMGRILHKAVLPIPAWSVKPLFWLAWHLTHGRIPTRPDSSEGLIYPINVDGTRIEKETDFRYRHTAEEALLAKK